jgi:DNA-binding transcriptional regulator YiaG
MRMSETADLLRLAGWVKAGQARAIRKDAGLTAGSVATDLGVSASTVAKWETGKVTPPRARALAWLRLLREIDATVKAGSGE